MTPSAPPPSQPCGQDYDFEENLIHALSEFADGAVPLPVDAGGIGRRARRRRLAMTGASVTALLAVVGGGAVLATTNASPSPSAGRVAATSRTPSASASARSSADQPTVQLPDVVGLTLASATTALRDAGLHVGTVSTQFDTRTSPSQVIATIPAPNNQVPPGSTVDLWISKG
jgi:PASTA domain